MARRVSSRDSRDMESFVSSRSSRLSSDDSEDDFPAQAVDGIEWLKLTYTTPEEWRRQARKQAERFWMLQRRARVYEALENLKALHDKPPTPETPPGKRDIGDVD